MNLGNFNSSAEKNHKQSSIRELGDSVTLNAHSPGDEITQLFGDQQSNNVAAKADLVKYSTNGENNVAALGTASLGRAAEPPPSEKSSTLDAKDPKTMLIDNEEACGFVSPSMECKASAASAQLVTGRKRRPLAAIKLPVNDAAPPLPPREKTDLSLEQSKGPPLPPREKTTKSSKEGISFSAAPAPPLPPRPPRDSPKLLESAVPPLPPRGEPVFSKSALQIQPPVAPPVAPLISHKVVPQPPEPSHLLKTTCPCEETDARPPPLPPRPDEATTLHEPSNEIKGPPLPSHPDEATPLHEPDDGIKGPLLPPHPDEATPLHEPDDEIEGPPLPPRLYEVTDSKNADGPPCSCDATSLPEPQEALLIINRDSTTFPTSIEAGRRASSPCPPLKERNRAGTAPIGPPLEPVLLPVPLSPSHSSTPSLLQPHPQQIFITEEKCQKCPILKDLLSQPRVCEKCDEQIKPPRRHSY